MFIIRYITKFVSYYLLVKIKDNFNYWFYYNQFNNVLFFYSKALVRLVHTFKLLYNYVLHRIVATQSESYELNHTLYKIGF